MKTVVLFIFLLLEISSFSIRQKENTNFAKYLKRIKNVNVVTNDKLFECSNNIIQKNANKNTILMFNSKEDFISTFLRISRKNFIIVNMSKSLEILRKVEKPDFYLMIVNDIKSFNYFVEVSYRTRGWNATAKILVVYLGNEDFTEIFTKSWKYRSINLSLITKNNEVYTYFPLKNGQCGENIEKRFLFNCSNGIGEVFPKKTDKYFPNCTIKVFAVFIEPYVLNVNRKTNPGFEIVILREISKRLKFSIEYVKHDKKHWGTKLSDGSYTDLYELMFNFKAELMLGMVPANESYIDDFEELYPHTEDEITYWVPTPLLVEGWKNFIIIFDFYIWILLMVSIIFASIVWWLIGLSRKQNAEGYDILTNCFIKVFGLLFSSFNLQPNSWYIRSLFVMMSLYGYLMCQTYQSVLISFLTRPTFEKEINTIKEMVYSNLEYGGFYSIHYIFKEKGNEAYLKLYDNYIECPLTIECLNRTAQQRNFGVIKNSRQVRYLIPKIYTYPNGRPMLKRTEDKVTMIWIWFQTTKGFLYKDRFNEMIFKLRENGLIFKWEKDAVNTWKRSVIESYSTVPLNFHHLKAAFIVLIIGLGFSVSIFLIEIKDMLKSDWLKSKIKKRH